MHKNLMGKLIKSNNVNRGEYTYIYGGSELVDIVTCSYARFTDRFFSAL